MLMMPERRTTTRRRSPAEVESRTPAEDESGIPAFGRKRMALLAAVWCALVALPLAPILYAHLTAPSSAQRYLVYLDGYSFGREHPTEATSSDFCDAAAGQAPHRLHDAFKFGCSDGSVLGNRAHSQAVVDEWLETD